MTTYLHRAWWLNDLQPNALTVAAFKEAHAAAAAEAKVPTEQISAEQSLFVVPAFWKLKPSTSNDLAAFTPHALAMLPAIRMCVTKIPISIVRELLILAKRLLSTPTTAYEQGLNTVPALLMELYQPMMRLHKSANPEHVVELLAFLLNSAIKADTYIFSTADGRCLVAFC